MKFFLKELRVKGEGYRKSPSATPSTRGFTLVETLVAIAILMIAISGPLSIAYQALAAALYARDQSIASFLAQEEMEIIKNIRDNNIENDSSHALNDNSSPNWLTVPAGSLTTCTGSSSACGVSVTGSLVTIQNCTNPDPCQIYSDPSSDTYTYSSSPGNQKTLFTRYFYLTSINPNEYRVTVVVSWNEGTVPNQVALSSQLVNHLR